MQPEPMLFPVVSAPGRGFFAGHLPNLRQTLVARSVYGKIIVAIFDADGRLLEVIRKDLPSDLLSESFGGYREVDEEEFHKYLEREFGFTPGLIRIKEFHLPQEMFAVYHLPQHYQEFLENPNSPIFGDEERQSYPELIRKWRESGQFVLEWGNDYWLDQSGEVTAS